MKEQFFDGYAWRARVLVAVVILMPVWVILPWMINIFNLGCNPWFKNAVVVAGLTTLGSVIVRNFGVIAERKLHCEWGALPTTLIMRWSDIHRSKTWKDRMHGLVASKLEIQLYSLHEEMSDPMNADRLIAEAFDRIRSIIWGQKDLPSYAANVNYGFVRNLYGSRWLWLILSICCTLTIILLPIFRRESIPVFELSLCSFLILFIPIVEYFIVRRQIEHCAFRYAEHAWAYLDRM